MKISTKSRYGLRALMYIAINQSENNKISLKEISENEEISLKYLEQIFSLLTKEKIVYSKKGSKGGYYIKDKYEDIKIGEILKVLEGDLEIVDISEKDNYKVEDIEYLLITQIWEKGNFQIINFFNSITLKDLMRKHKNVNMYYI